MLPWILLAYKSQKCRDDTECTFMGCLRGHTGKDLLIKEQFMNGGLNDVAPLPWGIRSINQCHKKDHDQSQEEIRLAYVAELEEAKGLQEVPPASWERPENPEAHILEYWEVEVMDIAYFLRSLDPYALQTETYDERMEREFQKNVQMYGWTILRALKTYFLKCRVVKTYTNKEGWSLKTAARRWIPVIHAAGGVEGYLESLRSGEAKEPEMPSGLHCHVADCNFVCASERALKKHNKRCHRDEEKGAEDEPYVVVKASTKTSRVPDDLICPHCDRKCKSKKIWKAHVRRHKISDSDSDSEDEVILGTYTRGGAGGAGGPDLSQAFTSVEEQLLKEEKDAEDEAASMVITLTLEKHTRPGTGKKYDKPSTTWSLSFEGVPERLIPRLLPLLKKIDGPFSKLNKQLKTIKTKPGKHFGDDQISQCIKVFKNVCNEYTVFFAQK
jgi:rubredoxin